MAYGIASRAEVQLERDRINVARQTAERLQLLKDWASARSEARACGYQFMSFSEWLGEINPKDAAVNRYMNEPNDYYFVD